MGRRTPIQDRKSTRLVGRWVEGHQDKTEKVLDWWAKKNQQVDT